MPSPSKRLQNLPPYVFSVIGDRLREMQNQGIDVLRLDIGNPDMPPPDSVIEALGKSSRESDKHGYSGYRGVATFRQAIAEHYRGRFGIVLNPDTEVLPLLGSKEGIINLCLAYLDHGDASLVPDTGYPSYAMGARLAGADIHYVQLQPEQNYEPNIEHIPADIVNKARLFWVNYPNNPTGAIVDLECYRGLITFCREHDILLASDNPYIDITYDGYQAPSLLQASPDDKSNLIEFFSFSKSYNMAGWRLGAAVGDAKAINNLLNIKSNVDSGHFKPIYDAGSIALKTPRTWIDERNAIYQRRRDIILEALPQIGLSATPSAGSLYVWAKVLNSAVDSYVERAREEAHVSLAPGTAYGPGGNDYVRLSVAVPDDKIQSALNRLKVWYALEFEKQS